MAAPLLMSAHAICMRCVAKCVGQWWCLQVTTECLINWSRGCFWCGAAVELEVEVDHH